MKFAQARVEKMLKNQKAWERGWLKHMMGGPAMRRRCLRRNCAGTKPGQMVCRALPYPDGKPMPL